MGGFVGKITDAVGLTDIKGQEKAAKNAANAQAQSGEQSIALQRESRDLARQDLQPFREFGASTIPAIQALLSPSGQIGYLENNPLFRAAIARSETPLKNTFGYSGLRGDLSKALTENYMAQGENFINNQYNRLLSPVQIGQASAAGQANATLSTGQQIGNTITDIGNARAAGIIGTGNAYTNGINSLLSAGASLGGAYMGMR